MWTSRELLFNLAGEGPAVKLRSPCDQPTRISASLAAIHHAPRDTFSPSTSPRQAAIMPPKNKKDDGKAKKPAASKTVQDKTFGMKNKKGSAAQKQIKQIQSSVGHSAEEKRKAAEKEQRARDKAAAEAARKETEELLNKPAQIQKVPFGVDPKTVLCIFFKKGNCEKGKKCKFSHDLTVERKTEKKSLYTDGRTEEDEKEKKKQETSEDWDEEKLRKVVLSKKGNQQTTTDKVCKYFIEAIEDGKYGWFWTCPNGGNQCKYKHALPPGYVPRLLAAPVPNRTNALLPRFVLKTKEQRAAEKALLDKSPLKTLTLEEFLETERHKLTGTLTPVTPESFAKWKQDRISKKAAEEQARQAKEATGRALFESGNWRFGEDDDGDDDDDEDAWNLEKMRKETEAIRQRKEEERLAAANGYSLSDVNAQPPEAVAEASGS